MKRSIRFTLYLTILSKWEFIPYFEPNETFEGQKTGWVACWLCITISYYREPEKIIREEVL